MILADTKFEFGFDADGDAARGRRGAHARLLAVLARRRVRSRARRSRRFDKQYVRDWVAGSGWDKKPPAPAIPDDVVERHAREYVEAYERITGEPFARLDWTGPAP